MNLYIIKQQTNVQKWESAYTHRKQNPHSTKNKPASTQRNTSYCGLVQGGDVVYM